MVLKIRLIVAGLLGLLLMMSAPALSARQQSQGAPGGEDERQQNESGPHRGGRRRGPGEMHMLRMLRELNLTEAQQQQARTIVENYLASIKPQREELLKLREEWKQNGESAELHSRAQTLHGQIQESTKNMRAQLLDMLTPDQRAKLDQMETEFKARREQRRERRRDMSDGPESDQQQN
jgi:Spy/CpxP family protein refolding chaperone